MKVGQRLDKQLFVFGNELCIYTSAAGATTLRSGQMTLCFVVDLFTVTREVADCVIVERGARGFRLTEGAHQKAEQAKDRILAPVRARRALAV